MLWILLAAGLGLAAVAEELGVTAAARSRAEQRLSALVGSAVHVRLHGRPLAWHLAHRRVPDLRATAREVPVGDDGGLIDRLEVRLTAVDLPRGRPGTDDHRPLRTQTGRFEARVGSDQLAELLAPPPGISRLQLVGDALRVVTAAGVRFDTSVTARDGALVITADRGIIGVLGRAEFTVPLPDLPAGASIEHARVAAGTLIVRGPIDGSRLAER